MPKRAAEDAVHVRMTDHKIAARPSAPARAELEEDTGERRYQGGVRLYYPESMVEDSARELYLALAQVKDGANLAAGAPKLERAIQRYEPEEPEFLYYLAEAYRQAGEFGAAAGSYSQALGRDGSFWPAAVGLGLTLTGSGDLAGAVKSLELALELAPREPAVAVALGDVYYRLQRLDAAREALRLALAADASSPEAHNNLGAVYFAQGKGVAAQAEFREAIRHRPDYGAAHGNLAALLLGAGAYAEAAYHYGRALRSEAATAELVSGYGRALAGAGRLREARRYLIEAAESNVSPVRRAAEAALRALDRQ